MYFIPLNKKNIKKRINDVIKMENVQITKKAKKILIERSRGDMRNILNALQSISIIHKKIKEDHVNEYVSYPKKSHVKKIFKLLQGRMYKAYKKIHDLQKKNGYSLFDILDSISKYIIKSKEISDE